MPAASSCKRSAASAESIENALRSAVATVSRSRCQPPDSRASMTMRMPLLPRDNSDCGCTRSALVTRPIMGMRGCSRRIAAMRIASRGVQQASESRTAVADWSRRSRRTSSSDVRCIARYSPSPAASTALRSDGVRMVVTGTGIVSRRLPVFGGSWAMRYHLALKTAPTCARASRRGHVSGFARHRTSEAGVYSCCRASTMHLCGAPH